MDCSIDDALRHLRDWSDNRRPVRLAFDGRGLKLWYSSGVISDVSGGVFTFVSDNLRVEFDTGEASTAKAIPLARQSVPEMPDVARQFIHGDDDFALVINGGLGMLVLLKHPA
ncbi:MAG: hypothetical protein ACR2IF_09580 [Terriglobales bacterium]